MPNGGRYWRFSYRIHGRQKTLALGVYPDVSLVKARARHRVAREQLTDGIDPSQEKQASGKSFETVAREWFARWKDGRNERHAHYVIRRPELDIFPEIGSRHFLGNLATRVNPQSTQLGRRVRRATSCALRISFHTGNGSFTHRDSATRTHGRCNWEFGLASLNSLFIRS
jgi:Arm DNA-binding domain